MGCGLVITDNWTQNPATLSASQSIGSIQPRSGSTTLSWYPILEHACVESNRAHLHDLMECCKEDYRLVRPNKGGTRLTNRTNEDSIQHVQVKFVLFT